MKTKAICSFFVLFAIVSGIATTAPDAFADHAEVAINTGSVPLNTPGCEKTDECYTPSTATVDVGGVVTMTNSDSAGIHTYTSGTVKDNIPSSDGTFDSGILNADQSFEWSPDAVGEIPYYCMLHTWMQGTIIVQEAEVEEVHEEEHMEKEEVMDAKLMLEEAMDEVTEEEVMDEVTEEETMEEAEGLVVTITDSQVLDGTQVELEFSELHVNYDITATQGDEIVLDETGQHAMESTATHQIDAVGSDDNPITVEVVSLGIGAPGSEADWTGPTGTVATSQVVPEFGTIAMMILAVAIVSVIAVTAKSRVVPKF